MKSLSTLLFITLFCFVTAAATAEDESRFIPKNYSGKSCRDKNFRAKSYTSHKSARSDQYRDSHNHRSFWNIFKKKEVLEPKMIGETKVEDGKRFTEPEHSLRPAKQLDEKPLTDRSFESPAKATDTKEFVPDNRPRARNPLLEPRQGIKAPVQ